MKQGIKQKGITQNGRTQNTDLIPDPSRLPTHRSNGSHPRRNTRRPRGLSLVITLGLILLVGATFAALAAHLSAQVRRTQSLAVTSQQRELLHAGTVAVIAALQKQNDLPALNMPLPPELPACTLTCEAAQWLDPTHSTLTTRLHATVQAKTATAQLRLTHAPGGWTLVENTLLQSSQ